MRDRHSPRLLVVSESLGGGLGAAVSAQVRHFSEAGWQVQVAAPAGADLQAPHLAGLLAEVPIPPTIRDVGGALRASRELRTIVAEGSPDIVHCHGIRSFLVACGARVPASVTWHGSGALPEEPWVARHLRAPVHRITAALAQEAIAAGPGLGAGWTFLPHASPRLASLEMVPAVAAGSGPARFVFVGRLAGQKRVEMFIEALAEAARRVDVEGIIVGTGPRERELRGLVERLQAPVDLLGHRDDVGPLIASGRALVLTTHFEAVAFAAQEAMWVGRPVVASAVPSLEWLVGDSGRLVTSTAALIDAMVELSDPAVATPLGEAAARRVRKLIQVDSPWPEVERRFRARVLA